MPTTIKTFDRFRTAPRTILVGDLHGDPDALAEILRHACLMDADGNWSGGSARLIQLGDGIDRGPDSRAVHERLYDLQDQAAALGGEVVRLAGNHEMELVRGCLDYADNLSDPTSLAGWLRSEMAEGLLVAAAVAGPWVCVHGGLRSAMRSQLFAEAKAEGRDCTLDGLVEQANALLQRAAWRGEFDHALFGYDGIFWTYRPELCLSKGARLIPQVVGHSVCAEPFTPGHRFLFADQGISSAMMDHPAYLEIKGNELRWHSRESGVYWEHTQKSAWPGALSFAHDGKLS